MSTSQLATISRHENFYVRGGDVTFLTKGVLFRVHRYFFERDSSYFRGQLAHPATPGQPSRGTSDTNAIVLDDVSPEDFAQFLWIFYNPAYSVYDAALPSWVRILELAHRWDFVEVKNLAARELEDLTPVEKIDLFHRYGISRAFLIPSYAALCSRPEPPSLAECERLGMPTVHQIFTAREKAHSQGVTHDQSALHAIIGEVFELDITSMPQTRTRLGASSQTNSTAERGSTASIGDLLYLEPRGEDRKDDNDDLKQESSLDRLFLVRNHLGHSGGDDGMNTHENIAQGRFSAGNEAVAKNSGNDARESPGTVADVYVDIQSDIMTSGLAGLGNDSLVQVRVTEREQDSGEADRSVTAERSDGHLGTYHGDPFATTSESDTETNEQDTATTRIRHGNKELSWPQVDDVGSIDTSTLVNDVVVVVDFAENGKSESRDHGDAEGSFPEKCSSSSTNDEAIRVSVDLDEFPSEHKHGRKGSRMKKRRRIAPNLALNGDLDVFEDDEFFDSPDTPFPDAGYFGSWYS